LVLLLGAVVLALVISVAYGARSIPYSNALKALVDYDPTSFDHISVRSRLPRTLAGLIVGVALGLSGAVMQGVTRNPLADPGLLGVNAGASVAIVASVVFLGVTERSSMVWFGFLGAALAVGVVYAVSASGRVGATPVKMALAGAAVTAALISLLSALLLTNTAVFDQFRFWQLGSLSNVRGPLVDQIWPFALAGVVIALATGRLLNGLALGDDLARGLGQRVAISRGVATVAVIVLAGAATAAAGPIAFVGLAVPHIARAIAGSDYRWVLPLSAVIGPVLVLLADTLGRVVLTTGELPVGVVTAFFGAPVFIALVRGRKMAEL
jgi:iron complex transport system permease protein